MIDGVLQLELPTSGLDSAPCGPVAPLVFGPENSLLVEPLRRLLLGDDLADAARVFNPLVIVGPSGSGKSQLAQGLTRHWRAVLDRSAKQSSPSAPMQCGVPLCSAVAYFTAADFGRDMQAAAAEDRLAEWRSQVRSAKVLVIEDLERLRPRATIHQQFRYAIDAALAAGAVVVVTCDREPSAIAGLDPGVRDRLAAGLTVRLQTPGFAARQAILQTAAHARGVSVDEKQLAGLASREAASPAELLGRLASFAVPHVESGPRHGVTAREEQHRADHGRLKHIIVVAARYFGVTQAALVGPSRRSSLVRARNVIVHLARRLTALSYADIGRQLGGRDHTTIMHADRRLAEQCGGDLTLQQDLDELDRLVR